MRGQTAISVPNQPASELGPCTWCGKDGVEEIVLERDRYGVVNGKRVLKKRAILATVCVDHRSILEHQPRFYTCGCSYIEGEDRCKLHLRNLKRLPSQS